MSKELKTIDVSNMHVIRASKIIEHMIKTGEYKDFPEPTFFDKIKYNFFPLIVSTIIGLYLNIHLLLELFSK